MALTKTQAQALNQLESLLYSMATNDVVSLAQLQAEGTAWHGASLAELKFYTLLNYGKLVEFETVTQAYGLTLTEWHTTAQAQVLTLAELCGISLAEKIIW